MEHLVQQHSILQIVSAVGCAQCFQVVLLHTQQTDSKLRNSQSVSYSCDTNQFISLLLGSHGAV